MLKHLFFILTLIVNIYGRNIMPDNSDTLKIDNLKEAEVKQNAQDCLFWMEEKNKIITDYLYDWDKGNYICTWDKLTGMRETICYHGDDTYIGNMDVSDNNKYVICSAFRKDLIYLRCYSIEEKKLLWQIKNYDQIDEVYFIDNDKKILGVGKNAVYIVDTETGKEIYEWEEVRDKFPQTNSIETWFYMSGSKKYFVIWQKQHRLGLVDLFRKTADTKMSIWDIENRKIVCTQELSGKVFNTACFSDDDKLVYLGDEDGLAIWNLSENKISRTKINYCINGILLNKANNWIMICAERKDNHKDELQIYRNLEEYPIKIIYPFTARPIRYNKFSVGVSKDGRYLAIERIGKMFMYDTKTWKVLWSVDTYKAQDK